MKAKSWFQEKTAINPHLHGWNFPSWDGFLSFRRSPGLFLAGKGLCFAKCFAVLCLVPFVKCSTGSLSLSVLSVFCCTLRIGLFANTSSIFLMKFLDQNNRSDHWKASDVDQGPLKKKVNKWNGYKKKKKKMTVIICHHAFFAGQVGCNKVLS